DSRTYTSNATLGNFTQEADDVSVSHAIGDGTTVLRNGSAIDLLTLLATDSDTNESLGLGWNASIWVTTDGSSYDTGTSISTNSTGFINYNFDPTCSYLTGVQRWKGGTFGNTCYKNSNSSNFSVTLNAPLYPFIDYPNGDGFLRGDIVPINATLYDECTLVAGATPTFSVKTGAPTISCTNIVSGDGAYNCSWDSTSRPMGYYNATFSASKSYYLSNSTTKPLAFFLGSTPSLSNYYVTPTSDGWGALYTFHTDITDPDGNPNTLHLYKSLDGSNFTEIYNRTVTTIGGSNTTTNFQMHFTCGEIGANYFYFSTVDQFGFTANTSVKNFTMDLDDVTVTISGDSNTTVRRNGTNSALLKVRIYDSDYQVYPNNTLANIFITLNNSVYSANYTCLSDDGYCETYHDPVCTTNAGVQYWYAQTIDGCYKLANSSNTSLAVIGQLSVNVTPNFANSIALRDRNFTFSTLVSDECSSNITDADVYWLNETLRQLATNYTASWQVPGKYKLGPTTIQTNATRGYHDNGTNYTTIFIHGWSSSQLISPSNGTSATSGTILTIECVVKDNNTNANITNYPVNFYKNGALQQTSNTTSNGTAQWLWITSSESAGTYGISCIIANNTYLYYNSSRDYGNITVYLDRKLSIDVISPDYSTIYRNDSFSPYVANFSIHVKDANIGSANGAVVYLYNSTSTLVDNCTTDATGYCSVLFNPGDNVTPSAYTLYLNATKAGSEDSDTNLTVVTVLGKIFTNITEPLNGSFYSKADTAGLALSASDENGNPLSLIVYWSNESGVMTITSSNVAPAPFLLTSQQTGFRNFTTLASQAYYDNGESSVIIRVSGLADVSVTSPPNASVQAFPLNLTILCLVSDHDAATGIPNYNVTFYYNYSSGNFSTLLVTNGSGLANYSFTPLQKGQILFSCTIGNDEPKFYSALANYSEIIVTELDTRAPMIHNSSILPNDSLEANFNYTQITAYVTDDTNVSSVYASLTWPNSTVENVSMSLVSDGTFAVNYTPSTNGTYLVTIVAVDTPPEYNANYSFAGLFTSLGITNTSIALSPLQVIASGITQSTGYAFVVSLNITNTGPVPAYMANITIYDNSNSEISYNDTFESCGTIQPNSTCPWAVLVNVLPATPQKLIKLTTNASWRNPDNSLTNTQNTTDVIVSSNPVIDILDSAKAVTIQSGFSGVIENATIASTGNERLLNVQLTTVGGDIAILCPTCSIVLTPSFRGLLPAGDNFTTNISITVPPMQPPGSFWTFVQANASGLLDTVLINFTIPNNGSWVRSPASFGNISVSPNSTGAIGNITVTNQGNIKSTFTFATSGSASPFLLYDGSPVLALDLDKQISRNVAVTYSVSSGTAPGLYSGPISILSSNGTPSEQQVYINLNITDLPPSIAAVSSVPNNFEAIYGNSTVSAIITDNFGVSFAWLNSTFNGSTISQKMALDGTNYTAVFNSTLAGIHQLIVCANDTANGMNCSAPFNVTAHAATNLTFAIPAITISNVTGFQGANTSADLAFINPGYARSTLTYYNLSLPGNFSASPNNLTLDTIYLLSNSSITVTFMANAGVIAGTYHANLTVNWTNIDNTTGTNSTQVAIVVASNALLDINETLVLASIPTGSYANTTMTIMAPGTVDISSISFSCTAGVVCSSFTLVYSPSGISSLASGASQQVNITVTVPGGFGTGIYSGTITASGSNSTSDSVDISVTVPSNLSWAQSPSYINAEVIQGTSGVLGSFVASNIGNQVLFLSIVSQGNVSSYLSYNASSLLLLPLESQAVQINYSAPSVSSLSNYVGNATTQNATTTPPERATFINLTVHPLYVIILLPTTASPVLNINPGDNVSVLVNATYGSSALSGNVSFNVTLQDTSQKTLVALTSQTYSSGIWTLNFTAPALPTGKSYDLNVTGFDLARRLNLTTIETRAVGYTDTTPPQVDFIADALVISNNPILLTINATDSGTMFLNSSAVQANITYPLGGAQNLTFSFSFQSGDSYLYAMSFTNTTVIGNHTVQARVCDASGNCNFTSGIFEVRSAIVFAGRALDTEQISQTTLQPEFRLFSSTNTSSIIYNFSANSSGHYNKTLYNGTYFINTTLQSRLLLLSDVPLTTNYIDPITFGLIPTSRIGAGALIGILYSVNLTYSSANITFNYVGLPYTLENNLGIYTCNIYSQFNGCLNNWTRQTSIREASKGQISFIATNASGAYALAEYICGNGICEASTGESTAVCSTDCLAPNVTTTPTPSATEGAGGTGTGTGAGSGAGSGAGTGSATPSVGGGGAGQGNGSGGGGGLGGRIGPPEVRADAIDLTMKPGQKRTQVVDLVNNLDADLLASFLVEGDAAAFITIDQPTLTVKSRQLESVKVLINIPDSTFPGIYTADIIVKLGNIVKITPVTLRIEKSTQPLLDVKVSVLTKVVRPGDNIKAEVTIVNRGEAEAATDVSLQYSLKTLSEDKAIWTSSETVQISDLITRSPTAKVPSDAEPGIYIFQVTASYLEGRKVSVGSDSVEITGTSVTGLVVQTVTSSWLTYALILGIILFVGGRRAYAVYQQRKIKGQRYIMPLDYKKLPQPGPRAIPVGRVAETDVTAYFDIDKLQTHSIAAGGTGSGKSVSAQVVTEELLKRNVPVVIFDPTAQWTGYIRPNKDKQMLALYPKFGMKPEDVRGYKTTIFNVTDPNMPIDYKKYMNPGEITVFVMNKLQPAQLDSFVRRSVQSVFDMRPLESKELKLLIVYDEVHRLLPKYGGKGAYAQLERGYREFRKWGIGMFMISQVLLDFKGAIRANIANEIQLRTKYEGDIGRVKTKYGADYANKVTKLTIGTGLVQNPEYNEGKPWFVAFRPLLHSTFALTEEELQQITGIQQKVDAARQQIEALKAKGTDTYDVELELKIANDKLKQGLFRMSETYLDSVGARLKSYGSKR
ncbi:MAG: DUF87 domain-containing protein, partial [Candidatus Micrarchaeota archaeon]